MDRKPTCEELEKRIRELEKEAIERKQTEEALQEGEERFRNFLENLGDIAYETDSSGNVTYGNKMSEIMTGVPLKDIVGKPFLPHFEKESQEIAIDAYQRTLNGESPEFELTLTSGRICHFKNEPLRDKNGRIIGVFGIARDVTSTKLAENALRESEERYRSFLQNFQGIAYQGDMKFTPLFFHGAVEPITGYTEDEFTTGKPRWDQIIHPDDLPKLYENAEKVRSIPDYSIEQEYRILRKDGQIRWIREMGQNVCDNSGRPILVQGALYDITGQKLAQEERKKLEARLQRAQKMEVIGTLAGGVAHDLNNILAGLVSYPELLLLEIPKDSPLRNPILTIQKSGEKAAAIVQDLLTLARRGVTVTEVVNLNLIISEYVKSPEHERIISFHPGVQVRANLEADLLNILGSPAHLSKTVMNLVSNAAEAMSEGGTVSISTENRYIDRLIRGYDHIEEGDYVILTVSDTGVGILPTDMERIFEPFYTKKAMGRSGTGLGMAVVWGTVKDHKGYIDVKSAEGKGTTFTLYFPITRKELAKDKSLVSIEDYMGDGESLLVVDDVEEQREIASRILKKLGYSVTSVSSGEEAVDYLKDNSADLLVLDMIMEPGIDGYETYKSILEFVPKQKALIVSGFSETDRVKEAQRLGAGVYVKKPYLLEKIGMAVRDELDR